MRVGESKLRQYLLENLSEKETEEIDLQIFDDDELETALILAEEDLIEDYLDETLSSPERELFQNNFLVSRDRREHLALLTQLKNKTSGVPPEVTEKPLSFTEKLANLFRSKFSQVIAFASLALIFAVFGWWFVGLGSQNGEIAALNKKDLSDLNAYQKTSNLNLSSDVLRGNNSGKILQKDLLTENVIIRMSLRENIDVIPALDIYRGENRVETLKNVRVYKNPNGSDARLIIPASSLEKGNYRIEFTIENRKTTYNFSVE
jgi:hypothetical protein